MGIPASPSRAFGSGGGWRQEAQAVTLKQVDLHAIAGCPTLFADRSDALCGLAGTGVRPEVRTQTTRGVSYESRFVERRAPARGRVARPNGPHLHFQGAG